jgi:NitT/TauT family transport system permease protein
MSVVSVDPAVPARGLPPAAAPVATEEGRPRRDRRTRILLQIVAGVVLLGIWEAAVRVRFANPIVLGDPIGAIRRFFEMLVGETVYSRTIYDHLLTSLQVVALGYAGGAAAGIALGFVIGRSRPLARIFEPLILAIASVPKIAIAPLFVIVLGIGIASKLSIVFIEVFFMVFFNTMRGVFEVNEEYVHIARIIGASRWEVLRRIVIPAAMPDIMLGLRMAVPFAVTGVILAEFISSNQGIGWLILYTSSRMDPNGLWAALAFLVVMTWALAQAIVMVESRLLAWQPQRREGAMQV